MKLQKAFLATLFCCGALLAGCEQVDFSAVSSPAPGAVAQLDNGDREIQLSAHTALAIECSTLKGPCHDVQVRVADNQIVQVYPASVDRLVASYSDGRYAGDQPASVWIVAGLQAGMTRIHFGTDAGSADFDVFILDAL